MVIKYLKLLLTSILALSTVPLLATCPVMEVWSDGTNYRYLIKDVHVDYKDGRHSIKQQADIIQAALQKKAEGVFVLVECSQAYSGNNKNIQTQAKYYLTLKKAIYNKQINRWINVFKTKESSEIEENMSFLYDLIPICQRNQIPHYNIECAQGIHFYQEKFIPKKDVLSDLQENIAEIKNAQLVQHDYRYCLKQSEELGLIASAKFSTFSHMFSQDSAQNRKRFIEKAREIRDKLVDAKAINKLIEWNTIKHGFICAGAKHFIRIEEGLRALGYTCVKKYGNLGISAKSFDTLEKMKSLLGKNDNLQEQDDAQQLAQKLADLKIEDLKKILENLQDLPAALAEFRNVSAHALKNALDLKQIFAQIFADQEKEHHEQKRFAHKILSKL